MDNNLEERIEQLEKENELLRNWQQSTNQLISKMIDALNEQIKKQDYYEEKSLMLQAVRPGIRLFDWIRWQCCPLRQITRRIARIRLWVALETMMPLRLLLAWTIWPSLM